MKKITQRLLLLSFSLIMLFFVASCGKGDKITLEEFVALDNDRCSIAVKGVEIKDGACSIELELKNKSKDKNLIFSTDTSYVDGLECEFDLSAEVENGKTATVRTNLVLRQKNGYNGKFGEIEFNYLVLDSENLAVVASDTVDILPYGKDGISVYSRDLKNDKTVINSNGVKLSIVGSGMNQDNNFEVTAYIENNTEKDILIASADEDINGELISSYFSDELPAGKRKYTKLVWFGSDLADFGIEKVEFVNLYLYVNDLDTQEFIADGYASVILG